MVMIYLNSFGRRCELTFHTQAAYDLAVRTALESGLRVLDPRLGADGQQPVRVAEPERLPAICVQ
jgi:hypothetical protein